LAGKSRPEAVERVETTREVIPVQAVCWSPGKATVRVKNSADAPAASDLFHPTLTAVENGRRPDAEELEGVPGVVIRGRKIACRQIKFIHASLIFIRAGVHGPAEAVLGIELEGLAEAVIQLRQQRIESCGPIVGKPGYSGNLRVECKALCAKDIVEIVLARKVVRNAPLIAQGGNPLGVQGRTLRSSYNDPYMLLPKY